MAAPSFSSFPERFADPGPSTRLESPPRKPKREKKEKKHREKDKERENKKNRRERRAQDADWFEKDLKEKQQQVTETRRLEEATQVVHEKPLFFEDRVGDQLNLTYGGLHAGDIPKYNPVARGAFVMGLGKGWRANRRTAKGVEIELGPRRKMPRITDAESRAALFAAPVKHIQTDQPYKYEEVDGFLRLPSRREKEVIEEYRSILPDRKRGEDTDSGSSGSEDDDASDDGLDVIPYNSQVRRIQALAQRTKDEPTSVDAWLEFLNARRDDIPIDSPNVALTRSNVTVDILKKAFHTHPTLGKEKTLQMKYLAAFEDMDSSQLGDQWEVVLEEIGGADVWIAWLEWRMRSGAFQEHTISQDASRALYMLEKESKRTALDVELGQLRVFWRTTVALRDAGYPEQATALFQAQAELTFKIPKGMESLSLDRQLDALETFWDVEAPRVGEADAQGWSTWDLAGCPGEVTFPILEPPLPKPSFASTDPYEQWFAQEQHSTRASPFSRRCEDEPDPEDSYDVVLFTEIKGLLLSLSSPEAKDVFRKMWLAMLGLYLPGFAKEDDRWSSTCLSNPAHLDGVFPSRVVQKRPTGESYAGVVIGMQKEYRPVFGPLKEWSDGVVGPLDAVVQGWSMWTADNVKNVDAAYARRLFAQLRLGTDDAEWDTLALAFEAALNVKSALKLSRAFLSDSRNSFPLWAARARLERMRGKHDEARKIYQTVLLVSPPPVGAAGVAQLWWDWAEMEWLAGSSDDSLVVIVQSANLRGNDTTTLLRAKRHLGDIIQAAGPSRPDGIAWIKVAALFELLQTSVHAALLVFDDYLLGNKCTPPEPGTPEHESLTVSCLRILYNYSVVLKRPTPTSLIRERLKRDIDMYPSNTVILALFLEGEKGRMIWGDVRSKLGDGSSKGVRKDVVRRVAEIWIAGWDMGKWEAEVERTRIGLEGAMLNERTRGSPILWRVYIEFEIRVGKLQRAKAVLFRAIGECPLQKEFYLLAFGPLRPVFTPHELKKYVDVMVERGIRMRRDLENVLEAWEDPESKMLVDGEPDSDIDGEPLDELEEKANELRRLRPY